MFPTIVSLADSDVVTVSKVPDLVPEKRGELKRKRPARLRLSVTENDEHLGDDRDSLRPSEFVQRKLQSALRAYAVPVSTMHSERSVRRPPKPSG